MPEMYFFYTGRDMKGFVQFVSHPLLHACRNIGHANIEGHQYEDIIALGDDLRALHIHDNHGDHDTHMMLYQGTVNMDEVMHGLIDSGYKGYFAFAVDAFLPMVMPQRRKRKTFEKDTRLYETPGVLYEEFDRVMYTTGKHILEQYGIFEE